MKNFTLFTLFALLFFHAKAQITNNQINFEIAPAEIYYNGEIDSAQFLPAEVISSVDIFDGQWTSDICWSVDCFSVPCSVINNNTSFIYLSRSGYPFDFAFDMYFKGWESDNPPHCTFKHGDDSFWSGRPVLDSFPPSVTHNGNRWPSEWYSNENSSTNDWIFPNSTDWDLKLKTAYRYSNGDDCSNPLNFGLLNNGQEYSHFNSTDRSLEGNYSGINPLTYTNYSGDSSADVFYAFAISDLADVLISTDDPNILSFDTKLVLYDSTCNFVISTNNDIQAGVNDLSEIDLRLDAGTYLVQVEGHNGSEGKFNLQIQANYVVSGFENGKFDQNNVLVFPNPADNELNFRFENESSNLFELKVYEPQGRIIGTYYLDNNSGSLDISNYTSGIYIYQVIANGQNYRGRFIKR